MNGTIIGWCLILLGFLVLLLIILSAAMYSP